MKEPELPNGFTIVIKELEVTVQDVGDELAELVTAVNVHAPFVRVIEVGNCIVKVDEVGIA